jgi:hypothetical protein
MSLRAIAVALLAAIPISAWAAEDPAAGGDLLPLFDGKSLSGWKVAGAGKFDVEDGAIRAASDKKSFLCTEKTYGDFVLELETLLKDGGNSGVQFRSHLRGKDVVFGYQAEIDTSKRAWSGGLYDEGRRAWLNPLEGKPALQAAFRSGEWNRYRVACIGDWIRIWVNGVLTTDERDPLDLEGFIALQHHGEKGKVYRWRDIRLREIGRSAWAPLFDGKTLAGWESNGTGEWTVEDGTIVGRSKGEAKHGLLFSKEKFRDFTVRLKFKSVRGNSGLYFRVEKTADDAGCAGFQAEIDPASDVGGLYETGGRGWVVQPKAEDVKKRLKTGEWNDLAVSAHGGWIVVHLNGWKSADLRGDMGRAEGHLALQLHGGQEMLVQVKDIEILKTVAGQEPAKAPAAAKAPVGKDFVAVDPGAAAADQDFEFQGEYVGTTVQEKRDGIDFQPTRFGAQIVALGGGEFSVVHYDGGLPGEGWEPGKAKYAGKATLSGGILKLRGEGEGEIGTAKLEGDVLTVHHEKMGKTAELRKVHRKSETLGVRPPQGAAVLFDGSSADRFEGGKAALSKDGLLTQRAGKSIPLFGSCTVHLEFRTPYMPWKRDQDRGNSGLYLMGRYEVQVLDSFGVEPRDNQCGGIYSVGPPALNMCSPPLEWQTYDVDFTAPEFDAQGKKTKSARMTVRHNGVLIHKDREVDHFTTAAPIQNEAPGPGPVFLQDHGCQVRYRNIWVVEKK